MAHAEGDHQAPDTKPRRWEERLTQPPFLLFRQLPILILGVMIFLPDSSVKAGLRYLVFGWILLDLCLMLRVGYVRRRPYWTRDSWRRYLTMCAIPAGALVILVGMMVALEYRLPLVGEAHSAQRGLFTAGLVMLMLIGAGGGAGAVYWLAYGEPSRQPRFSPDAS